MVARIDQNRGALLERVGEAAVAATRPKPVDRAYKEPTLVISIEGLMVAILIVVLIGDLFMTVDTPITIEIATGLRSPRPVSISAL